MRVFRFICNACNAKEDVEDKKPIVPTGWVGLVQRTPEGKEHVDHYCSDKCIKTVLEE